jgi:dephospho-CoA kinase
VVTTVVCLAGGIASGKTTLAHALTERWPNSSVRSFGDVVRRRARAEGLPLDRSSLQEVGLRLIAEGWPAFVGQLLADLPPDTDLLIIDGVRHSEAVDALRQRLPDCAFLVAYLQADQAAIQSRLAQRGESDGAPAHPVEASLPEVARLADVVIDTTGDIKAIASTLSRSGRQRWTPQASGVP